MFWVFQSLLHYFYFDAYPANCFHHHHYCDPGDYHYYCRYFRFSFSDHDSPRYISEFTIPRQPHSSAIADSLSNTLFFE